MYISSPFIRTWARITFLGLLMLLLAACGGTAGGANTSGVNGLLSQGAKTPTSPVSTNTPSAPTVPATPTSSPAITPPASGNYTTSQPGVICDTHGGVWHAQNLDGINCPPAAGGTQLIINASGARGYLYLQQLPNNQDFTANNTITATGVLGDIASGYQTKCLGLAEQDANTGYAAEYCNNGSWFIASISSGGVILNKLDKGVVTMLTTATIALTFKGTTLSFSVQNSVIDTVNISALQPTQVAIVYDCVGYGANQTIGGNFLLVQDFSYQAATT